MNTINVNDPTIPLQLRKILQGLKELGFDHALRPYVTTVATLEQKGISPMDIQGLVTAAIYEQRDSGGNTLRQMGTVLRRAEIDGSGEGPEVKFELNYDLM